MVPSPSLNRPLKKPNPALGGPVTARKRLNDILAAKGGSVSATEIVAALDIEDRLEAAEQTVLKEKLAIELTKSRRDLLEKFTSGKTTRELKVDVERKRSEECEKGGLVLETSKRNKLERQMAACVIKAPADGLVVYANDPNRAFGSNQSQIEEGATVRERQKIFSLPDITRMQVNTKVHESQIDKLGKRDEDPDPRRRVCQRGVERHGGRRGSSSRPDQFFQL